MVWLFKKKEPKPEPPCPFAVGVQSELREDITFVPTSIRKVCFAPPVYRVVGKATISIPPGAVAQPVETLKDCDGMVTGYVIRFDDHGNKDALVITSETERVTKTDDGTVYSEICIDHVEVVPLNQNG